MRLDKVPFRSYLEILGWPPSVIDFTETVCSQTNQFALSFSELIMQNLDFDTRHWMRGWTDFLRYLSRWLAWIISHLAHGFRRLSRRVTVSLSTQICLHRGRVEQTFDKVILAIPPSALRMIPERPRWDYRKEQAIRAMFYEALYKIGLRFKTRFWEHVQPPSLGDNRRPIYRFGGLYIHLMASVPRDLASCFFIPGIQTPLCGPPFLLVNVLRALYVTFQRFSQALTSTTNSSLQKI